MSLVHVRDVVRAALLAGRADLASGEIFHIADPTPCDWEDIGRLAAGLLGKKPVKVRLPLWSAYLASAASEGLGRLLGRDKGLLNRDKVKLARAGDWVADVRQGPPAPRLRNPGLPRAGPRGDDRLVPREGVAVTRNAPPGRCIFFEGLPL